MTRRRLPGWSELLPAVAWTVLLAGLPWWLGLPCLLAVAAVLLLRQGPAARHAALLRRSLRWGLPGVLIALPRAFGGDLLAWGAALLGALAGFTLLAGLEAWLDRDRRRAPEPAASAEWPALAMAPIGPATTIIELQPPQWQSAAEGLHDPRGGRAECRAEGCRLADGAWIEGAVPPLAFSPEGGWFAAGLSDGGIVLWDRDRHRLHRLGGWMLCGWHGGQPWLARSEGEMPVALPSLPDPDDEG
ncbi:MAG: hypothetical protein KGJ63_07960 [Pseudomonadota bacterium]|jgi:hypothetical protein|nr:hypothetical protein [Pseudomonadota bacterium]